MDPHRFRKLDPDPCQSQKQGPVPDPHQSQSSQNSDPDLHQSQTSEAYEAQKGAMEARISSQI
jgi:hypothetical protein